MVDRKYQVDKYDDASSRYKYMWRIEDKQGNIYQETSDKITIPISSGDQYCEVTPEVEGRLDLISHQYYGTPLLWWVIAEASNIFNPLEIPVGTVLRIPPRSTLYNVGGVVL